MVLTCILQIPQGLLSRKGNVSRRKGRTSGYFTSMSPWNFVLQSAEKAQGKYIQVIVWMRVQFKIDTTSDLLIHRFKTFYFICSCKSLEYGLGYSSSGKFTNSLYKQGLGQCKLRSVEAPTDDLKSCYFDYYQKKPVVSAGSRGLLSKMTLFTMLVLLTLTQR